MYDIHKYTATNNLGTAVLLEELMARPVGKLVVASSMSIYGEGLYRRANGELSAKVFKWKNCQIAPGQNLHLVKNRSLKKITTRTYYPGLHKVALQINGTLVQTLDFELLD